MNYLDPHSSKRLLIRPLVESDAESWQSYFINNPNLKYFDLDNGLDPMVKSKAWLERQFNRYNENRYGLLALINKENNELIGQSGLLTQNVEGREQLEVGYHIKPQYWRQGFATEAAIFFKQFAFDNYLCEQVISIIHVDNIGSQKVAIKNGMKADGATVFMNQNVFIFRTNIKDQ